MNHTKLPWHVITSLGNRRQKEIRSEDGNACLAITPIWDDSFTKENHANAAFIVKACNNHYFFTELFAKIEAENDIEKAKIYAREALSKAIW